MPYTDKAQVFSASINATTIGCGENAVTIGGANVYPLYTFDAEIANMPKIGVEISDTVAEAGLPELDAYYAGATTVAEVAAKAAAMEGASFVALKLESADPNGDNASVESCVATATAVAEAIDKPLVIMGCKNSEKDSEVFSAIAGALAGKNVVFMSCKEEDYKQMGASVAMANGQMLCGESAVDINLAKQLNVLLNQLGVGADKIVMNLGTAAAGYGFEYVVSTMDRVKGAALTQNDAQLQIPVVTPIAGDCWGVKEALLEEADAPEWGAREERGIQMEIITAASCLASGSDAIIVRHPASVKTLAQLMSAIQ